MQTPFNDIDSYIHSQTQPAKEILEKIRKLVKEIAPEAKERIGYGMPAFELNGPLIYFAAFKGHIGFYPIPSGVAAFKEELSVYKQGKGSVQFPLDKPMPYDLIEKIVRYRVKENLKNSSH